MSTKLQMHTLQVHKRGAHAALSPNSEKLVPGVGQSANVSVIQPLWIGAILRLVVFEDGQPNSIKGAVNAGRIRAIRVETEGGDEFTLN